MTTTAGIPLAPADRAILALESPTVAGHTCKLVVLGPGAPDLRTLRASLAERIAAAPMLTTKLGGTPDAPAWVPDGDFDLDEHVVPADVDGPLDARGLAAEVARLFEQRLDRSRPLWRIDAVPLAGGAGALVWRIHHALADGTAAMRFARALLWDPVAAEPAPAAHVHAADDARRHGHLAGFVHREFGRSVHRSPFDGRIGSRREVGFASVPLRDLHDAAKALAGATVNDAVLAVVAGALRRFVEHAHGRLGSVRLRVPVSLHHEGDDAANADSFFTLALPLNEADPVARLRAVREATAARKADRDAETFERLNEFAAHSPVLRRLTSRLEGSPRKFAVCISNVPGPREPVSVLGAPVDGLYTLAEIGERHGLRVSVVSLAGALSFGFCADPAIVDDVGLMADGVAAETAALVSAAG